MNTSGQASSATAAVAANPLDLHGRIVVISGAAGALGQVIVTTLLAHGARVVAFDILPPEEAASALPPAENLLYVRADAADDEQVNQLLDQAAEHFAALPDAVCCHAGMVGAEQVHEFPLESFDQHVRVNIRGPFVLARAIARRWIAASVPGQLIFTSSWVQDVPWPGIAPYNATKAAVKSLTRSFARELAPHGIRSNAVAPGIVNAGMARRQWDEDPSYRARAAKAIPLGHLQPPQSVADVFLFLLSPLADYMTGSILVVDGGSSLYPMD